MATKKDLVEAHSFSRRRLVTAFVSGAPGGREVEPARPGRTIVGGIALAILLVAGAAVLGVFKSRVEIDWEDPGIVTDQDTGALFVILPDSGETGLEGDEPNVRGITNVTSARLILGPDEEVQEAPTDDIADQEKGATIGIPDAPATPSTGDLIQSGWTACTADGLGVQLRLAGPDESAEVTATPDQGYVVTAGGTDYLIAEAEGEGGEARRAYRYVIPSRGLPQLPGALGIAVRDEAIEVPERWVRLFPEGGDLSLDGFALEGIGQPAPGDDVPAQARIGDMFAIDNGLGLFTQDGPVSVTEPFAEALLRAVNDRRILRTAEVENIEPIGEPDYRDSRWPTDVFDPATTSTAADLPCGVLEPTADEEPVVLLAGDPVDEAAPDPESDPDQSDVSVTPGFGAVVDSGGSDVAVGGDPILLDERGLSHALVGSTTVTNLGYGDLDLPAVPSPWVELFTPGVELSRELALCPPTSTDGPGGPSGSC